MGKGDKKTAKGKRTMGSYGNTRPKKKSTPVAVKPAVKKEAAEAKPAAKKTAAKKTTAKAEPKAKTTAANKPAAKKTTTKKTEK